MLKKALVALALMLPVMGASLPAYSQTAGQAVMGFYLMPGDTYDGYTCPSTNVGPCFVQYGDSIPTTGGAGTSDVNVVEIGGNAVTTTLPVSGTVSIDQTTPGTTNGVVVNSGVVEVEQATAADLNATVVGTGTFATQNTPQTSATTGVAATHIVTAALAANLVVKASAGNLYGFNVSADSTLSGAAWWLIAYDATSAPADGAVTPVLCYAVPSGTTSINGTLNVPVAFATGITLGVSTTGCFTKTASTHAFIAADYK